MTPPSTITIVLARDADDVEFLRVARNANRFFMTNDQSEISAEQQQAWWTSPQTRMTRRVCVLRVNGHRAGFSIVTRRVMPRSTAAARYEGWLTGVVVAECRGRGLGEALFLDMIYYCQVHSPSTPMLQVFEDNEPAVRLYQKLGFTEVPDAPALHAFGRNILTMELL